MNSPKVLFLDIETAPLLSYCWGIWKQDIRLNQIKQDWCVLSWAAKWQGSKTILYQDQRHSKDIEKDGNILKGIWKLLDEADVVIGHNAKAFDIKKLNARFIINEMQPPSPYQVIDTLQLARKSFKFTSNKLEHLSERLNIDHKKSSHKKYPGFSLWKACLNGDQAAWKEIEHYNKQDVLALEEVYKKLSPWGTGNVNFNVLQEENVCSCGSREFRRKGFEHSRVSKRQRYQCKACGRNYSSGPNLLTNDRLKEMLR